MDEDVGGAREVDAEGAEGAARHGRDGDGVRARGAHGVEVHLEDEDAGGDHVEPTPDEGDGAGDEAGVLAHRGEREHARADGGAGDERHGAAHGDGLAREAVVGVDAAKQAVVVDGVEVVSGGRAVGKRGLGARGRRRGLRHLGGGGARSRGTAPGKGGGESRRDACRPPRRDGARGGGRPRAGRGTRHRRRDSRDDDGPRRERHRGARHPRARLVLCAPSRRREIKRDSRSAKRRQGAKWQQISPGGDPDIVRCAAAFSHRCETAMTRRAPIAGKRRRAPLAPSTHR